MVHIYWILACFLILCIHNFSRGSPLTGETVKIAEEREFPFVVSLSWKYPTRYQYPERNHFCFGALITENHVLTAAHCVKLVNGPNDFVVKVNKRDLRDSKSYQVKKWTTYIEWAKTQIINEFVNDIAVISLCESVLNTKPAFLSNIPPAELHGKKAQIVGQGSTDNNVRSRFLLTAELDILQPKDCLVNLIYEVSSNVNITIDMIMCTSANPPVYTECTDSGTPLFIKPDEIIAVHKGHCKEEENGQVIQRQNFHVFVYHYREFVTDVTNGTDEGRCSMMQIYDVIIQ